jgi:hypothetical protein
MGSPVDLLGYAASALVLWAFSLRSLVALRAVAITSNLAFIGYALAAHLPPVLLLHAALLPVNLWRLWQCRSQFLVRRQPPNAAGPSRPSQIQETPP